MRFDYQELEKVPSLADENWWLAFAPILIVIIIFYVMRKGILSFFMGNKMIAKLFRVSDEKHKKMMKRFEEQTKNFGKEKASKKS